MGRVEQWDKAELGAYAACSGQSGGVQYHCSQFVRTSLLHPSLQLLRSRTIAALQPKMGTRIE
jgi:hypothetical protein